jgi:hypothetical protein
VSSIIVVIVVIAADFAFVIFAKGSRIRLIVMDLFNWVLKLVMID